MLFALEEGRYGACLMLYAKDSLAVDPKVGLVRMRQSSHAHLHPRHEVRPRHSWRRTFETHERLGRLGKVNLAAVREGGGRVLMKNKARDKIVQSPLLHIPKRSHIPHFPGSMIRFACVFATCAEWMGHTQKRLLIYLKTNTAHHLNSRAL